MLDIEWVSRSTLTEAVLLAFAFVLSAVIGLERERQLKSAGVRTHTLVGLGSALFTLVSSYGFSAMIGPEVVLDPSRIAAQIVSGIGFLGAGVIFVRQNAVTGLTTAASIWVAAAVGMACGAGMPVLAALGAGLHLLTVSLLAYAGRWVRADLSSRTIVIRYKEGDVSLHTVLQIAGDGGLRPVVSDLRKVEREGKKPRIEARLTYPQSLGDQDRLLVRLTSLPGVVSATSGPSENE